MPRRTASSRSAAAQGLGRAVRLAGMAAGVTGSYAGYMVQRLFLGAAAAEGRRLVAHARAGRVMRGQMEQLRGPMMKLGQALSLQSDLPPQMLEELAKLQMQAPAMHASLARAQFTASVGCPPEQAFRTFEAAPFAAASLGQVHRATARDGTPLAVKIQYPGIISAIEHDFRWLRSAAIAGRASGHVPKDALSEIESEILAETDYLREARHLEFFRQGLRPLGFVSVPECRRETSTDRVLTMTRLDGQHLEAFLATRPSQALRDRIGNRLFELFYYQLLRLEALHADPHWGNYLFDRDGGVGLVDFGCVKRFAPGVVKQLRRSCLYPGSTASAEFQRIIQDQFAGRGQSVAPAVERAVIAFAERFYRKVYPVSGAAARRPFDFSDGAFLRDYTRAAAELFRARGVATHYIFLVRAETGLYATLHRLGARVGTTAILRRLLESRG